MDSNSIILFLVLVSFCIFFYKYFISTIYKYRPKLLIDDQFQKPQSFHELPISVAGGACIFFSFLIIIANFIFLKGYNYFDYFSFCTVFFIIGFTDDLKINIKPKARLAIMILAALILIKYNNFYIEKTGIQFLNELIEDYNYFSLFFVCLCFLFIINGANLIDGYNGLLGLHSLIILINLFVINFTNSNFYLSNIIFFQIIVVIMFLFFNFPKAKVFLGDGGAYFLGTFIAISAIKTSIDNQSVSAFYFCILLFYLFFEVFFSFFRKIIKEKKSPIHPDNKHLHMILYKMLLKKNNNKLKSNYHVSLIINSIYFILLLPATFMKDNGIFCKYYSIIFFVTYIFCYKASNEKQ